MKNVYEKLESLKELSLMDIYTRLNQLELENKLLKADKIELLKENMQLKVDNEVLHNKINENIQYATVVDGNEDMSYVDEYAKGFEIAENLGYKIV